MKIVSGAQTGVDRAALDAALKHGIECGGWVPAGRLDEFDRIPDRYPVRELDRGGFAERTLQNIKDSDGTVIIYCGAAGGGTAQTIQFCVAQKCPHLLVDAADVPAERAAGLIAEFVRQQGVAILNIAGPRQTEWASGYDYVFRALDLFLSTSKIRNESG